MRCIESGASDSESPISISDLTGKQQQQQQLYFIQISMWVHGITYIIYVINLKSKKGYN